MNSYDKEVFDEIMSEFDWEGALSVSALLGIDTSIDDMKQSAVQAMTRILKIKKCLDCPNSQHSIDYVDENGELTGGETVGGWCWFDSDEDGDAPPTLTRENMLARPPDWCGLPLEGAE